MNPHPISGPVFNPSYKESALCPESGLFRLNETGAADSAAPVVITISSLVKLQTLFTSDLDGHRRHRRRHGIHRHRCEEPAL